MAIIHLQHVPDPAGSATGIVDKFSQPPHDFTLPTVRVAQERAGEAPLEAWGMCNIPRMKANTKDSGSRKGAKETRKARKRQPADRGDVRSGAGDDMG